MSDLLKYLKANWKTVLIATIAVIYAAPQFVTAIQAWANHQPADWRHAVLGLIVAVGFYLSKTGTNHSTMDEVHEATMKANNSKEIQ